MRGFILFSLFTWLFISHTNTQGQNCDDNDRYIQPSEQTISRSTVTYASALDYLNVRRNLNVHVYEADGDTVSNRPLIILAHGGAFLFGNKTDMRSLCEEYARHGYVCASIDYRLYPILLGFPDSAKVVEIAFNAISDMKAAVRYFRLHADTSNTFRIDPNKIFVGGMSAGAIMALHVGILDKEDPLTEEFERFLSTRGGIEGTTGDSLNRTYSSAVSGIINFSGALFDLQWLDEDDPMIMSMHGDADDVVPFGSAREGAFNRVTCHGSGSIHQRAEELNLLHHLTDVPGGGHSDIYGAAFASYTQQFRQVTLQMKRDEVCGATTMLTTKELPRLDLVVFPNPSDGFISAQWNVPVSGDLEVLDLLGNTLVRKIIQQEKSTYFENLSIPSGLYLLVLRGEGFQPTIQKVMIK